MTNDSEDSARDLVRWEQPRPPRAFVLEGEMLGGTPEGQIRLLRTILESLAAVAPAAEDPMQDLAAGLLAKLLRYRPSGSEPYQLADEASKLLGPPLPYTAEDLSGMLELLVDGGIRTSITMPLIARLLRHVERYTADHGLPEALRSLLEREREKLRPFTRAGEYGRLHVRLERLLEPQAVGFPEATEPWASVMLTALSSMDADVLAGWTVLLAHAAAVEQTRPSAKWLRQTAAHVERVGFAAFRLQLLSWLGAAAESDDRVLSERNGTVIKGLAWTCCTCDDPEIARTLARLAEALLRWLPTRLDWRGLKAGNACLNALGMMPGSEPLSQLARLSLQLKGKQLQTSVGRALQSACERRNLAREDVEELTVPSRGLDAGGCLRAEIGGAQVVVAFTGQIEPEWRWTVGGREQATPPASLRGAYAGELRALRAATAEIRGTLAAQRARMEGLFLTDRGWSLAEWRDRYLCHPLLATITRSLIWELRAPAARTWRGMPAGESLRDAVGLPFAGPAAETVVKLWHPAGADPSEVEAWRRYLSDRGITQPFKQVEREIYALTPEEWVAGASARFAGRVLRQQQLNALCRERGWQYAVRGPWHGSAPCAIRPLPQWNARAELWVRAVRGPQAETGRTGYFPHVSADVLRFAGLDGGVCLLTEVPERVLSEILRDVDLFVSVAGVKATSVSENDGAPRPKRSRPGGMRRLTPLPVSPASQR